MTASLQPQQKLQKDDRATVTERKEARNGRRADELAAAGPIGNQATQRRLKLSRPQEPAEVEADRVAEAVMLGARQPAPITAATAPAVQRKCAGCEQDDEIQRKAVDDAPATGSSVAEALPRDTGERLPGDIRDFFEPRFGHDFSRVRVHTGAWAAQSAQSLRAKAYTFGRNVVFGEGHYSPQTAEGRQLLAHELAHVVQQGRGGATPSLDPGGPLERAAESAAAHAVQQSGPVAVSGASSAGVARAPLSPYRIPFWEEYEFGASLTEELGLTSSSAPKGDIQAAVRDAQQAGLMKGPQPGTADVAVQPHDQARNVRQELDLAGTKKKFFEKAPSWEWLRENWEGWRSNVFESAHLGPGAFLRHNARIGQIQGYDYKKALTSLQPKDVHRQIDKPWVDWLRELRKSDTKEITARQLYEKMAEGIRKVEPGTERGQLTPETKGTLEWKLFDELFRERGLHPDTKLKVPPGRLNLKTVGGGALAAAGSALEFYDLKKTGHTTEESLAQALGSGIGGFAAPGGLAGMGLGLATAGLEALGAPKKVTSTTRTVGDVLGFTGASLGQVFRADVNIQKAVWTGDWRDFDRQTKEITQGKAGVPLEGYFRTVDVGVDLLSGKDFEQVFLKQKFSSTEDSLWYVVGGDRVLKTAKFIENLAGGKNVKDAYDDADKQFHNSLEDDIENWAAKQGTQFIKQDLPEAAEFAKKDLKGLVNKGAAQLNKLIRKTEPKKTDDNKGGEAPPALPSGSEIVQELKTQAKEKFDAAEQIVKQKYEQAKGTVEDKIQKGKALLGKYVPFL